MKILVTGGAGFIGSNLVKKLVQGHHQVVVVDNLVNGKRGNVDYRAKLYIADIRDNEVLDKIFKVEKPTIVFHLAALPRVQFSINEPLETNSTNIDGTLSVLMACKDHNVTKLIYSSSSSVYGHQTRLKLHEALEPNPQSPYALQKLVGEKYCKMFHGLFGLRTVCLRYFNVYGPGQPVKGAYALVIGKFIKQAKAGKPLTITGDGKQTRDFTYITDVVNANLQAMKSDIGEGEVINIGRGHNISINKVANFISEKRVHIKERIEPHDTLADNSLAGYLIEWYPKVTIASGIDKILRYERKKDNPNKL